MTDLFFVYGTLKRGNYNNKLLYTSKYIGKGLTLVNYQLYNAGFPIAVYDEEGKPILGEVYKVESNKVVEALDRLESNGSFYTRAIRPIKILDFFEEKVSAWIYEVPKEQIYQYNLAGVNEYENAYEWKR